jgi:ABC-type multidrug transport system fused ATPase/permease subunit
MSSSVSLQAKADDQANQPCTSSMDAQTDALAQKALREFCAHRTILCVAHRLDTILDSDRVLVLDKGRIVEEGAPNDLVNVTGSVFGGLLGDR